MRHGIRVTGVKARIKVKETGTPEPLVESKRLYETKSSGNNWSPAVLWYDTDRIENDASNNSCIVVYIRCRWNVFTEPLPNSGRGDALYRDFT
jgi:hypothetical protein